MNRNIIATILLVLAVGVYFTITEKFIADAKAARVVNAEYISAIDSAKKLIGVRDQVIEDYNAVSENDRQRLVKMIPNSVDNIRLIIDLNNVALRHGFSLQGIKAVAGNANPTPNTGAASAANPAMQNNQVQSTPGISIATPLLDTVSVSFEVTAPYLQFISFLQDIEANLRIMDVTSMSMKASDTGLYNFRVELKTYWLREQ